MAQPPERAAATNAAVPPLPARWRALPYRAFLRARARTRAVWPGPAADAWRGVRILSYHAVNDDPSDLLATPARRLGQHFDTVRAAGIEIIPLRDVYRRLETHPDGQAVAVVFDDGYRDMLINALPVLEAHGVPATVFVCDEIVSGTARCTWYRFPPPFMDWDELRKLTASGLVDVQPHGSRHLDLPHLDHEAASREILGCVERLAAEGFAPHTYCYAGGFHGPRERSIVAGCAQLAGAVSTAPGVNGREADRTSLRRTMIVGNERPAEFRAIIAGACDGPSWVATTRRALRRPQAARD
jgi:peptidoglycan/xylan/chitin deacetylase (PgdA/CDA1 family)